MIHKITKKSQRLVNLIDDIKKNKLNKEVLNKLDKEFDKNGTFSNFKDLKHLITHKLEFATELIWTAQTQDTLLLNEDGDQVFNLFIPPLKGYKFKYVANNGLFLMINIVLGFNKDYVKHFIRWIACKLLIPQNTTQWGILIYGIQGLGKSTLFNCIKAMFNYYKKSDLDAINCSEASHKLLQRNEFNSTSGRLVNCLDDVNKDGNHNNDKAKIIYDFAKKHIGHSEFELHKKGKQPILIDLTWITLIFSNDKNIVDMDLNDRRLTCLFNKIYNLDDVNDELVDFINNNDLKAFLNVKDLTDFFNQYLIPLSKRLKKQLSQKEYQSIRVDLINQLLSMVVNSFNLTKDCSLENIKDHLTKWADKHHTAITTIDKQELLEIKRQSDPLYVVLREVLKKQEAEFINKSININKPFFIEVKQLKELVCGGLMNNDVFTQDKSHTEQQQILKAINQHKNCVINQYRSKLNYESKLVSIDNDKLWVWIKKQKQNNKK